jgi:lathosterol oxidase
MVIRILLCIISYDVWFYLSHIILHNIHFYKTIHREHHRNNHDDITYRDTYAGHFIEAPFQGMGVVFPFLFIEFNSKILLCSLFIINIKSMLNHDKRMVYLVGNHHLLHHKYPQYNYGEYWLDKLFGTNYPHANECKYGIIYM